MVLGTLAAIAGAVWTGVKAVGNVLKEIFKVGFDILRTFFQFVMNHLPKPLRILTVILVIGVMGNTLVNFTVGSTHICESGEVYGIPVLDGMLFRLSPSEEKKSELLPGIFGFEGTNESETVTFGSNTLTFSYSGLSGHGDLYREDRGEQYFLTSNQPVGFFESGQLRQTELFGNVVLPQTYHSICYDSETRTCALKPGIDCDDYYDLITDTSSYNEQQIGVYEVNDNKLASLTYSSDTDLEGLRFSYIEAPTPFLSFIGGAETTIEGCSAPDNDNYRVVKIQTEEKTVSVPLVNTRYVPFSSDSQSILASSKEVASALSKASFAGARDSEPIDQEDDLVKVVCNYETEEDKNDVNVSIGGVNPFSTGTIIFLFLIGSVFAIRRYFE